MALSKLKIKTVDRDNLYFNKYLYRAYIRGPNLYWAQYSKDIDEYCERITAEQEEWQSRSDKDNHYWRSNKYTPDPIDYSLITHLIKLRKKYYNNKIIGMRHEGNSVCVYTNDLAIIEGIVKVKSNVVLSEAVIAPKGIKYFKNEPPAKYRAYMTNNQMPAEFKTDMIEYLGRTPDIRPSKAFESFLIPKRYHHPTVWLWSNYFVDYDDERNLMMLMLMFPGSIGKTYKLEKK
jgi:hypothetical protein